MQNPFENALSQLARATLVKEFPRSFIEKVSHPNRQVRISIPVTMDDGTTKIFEGYRVQHNNSRGPYKGGIRFHPDTDINEVKALAFWMMLKCAVANLPMGGGKGGVTVNPKMLSATELEQLSRGWVRGMIDIIGPKKDVPAPDVNTTPQIMAWMNDEYSKLSRDTSGACFTGKPIEQGGSEGRGVATGKGGFFVFDTLRTKLSLPEVCTVAIQGFGNVGGNAADIFSHYGHKVIAVSDSKEAIVSERGLDMVTLHAYKKDHGKLDGFPGTKTITNEELLELECDVLIPAALENQITEDNANLIKAKIILELANGPVTPPADEILFGRGIPVVPDILANAGGVTVSTFEWEQNLSGEHWSEDQVNTKLMTILELQSSLVYEKAKTLHTDLRRAAFIIALERLEESVD